ncbi:sialidase family protein [Corynebacterium sp. HS2168-gen11]|uniref:sialidase family protein n=1 Tax=Corynebacterium sp. HS2168-gen11 TaxID=2974027 RepID=UPI00216B3BD0|nr:sialidase family protein [Corynebacterium sp. HS2168-gen11]MCS4535370.1 glycoside hydrolase [Corynebacterium sp. HS2168-gen11]
MHPALHPHPAQKVISPTTIHHLFPQAAEVRVPALAHVGRGELLLFLDVRSTAMRENWEATGGAMAEDLPNPNSLLLLRGTVDGFSGLEVFRQGQVDPQTGYSDPCVIAAEQHVMVAYARSYEVGFFGSQPCTGETDAHSLHVEITHSYDGGRTWDTAKDITQALAGDRAGIFVTSGHGVRIDQTWALPVVGRTIAGETLHFTARSEDEGQSWHPGAPIGTDMDETAYGASAGRLYLSGRKTSAYATQELGRWWAISDDAGATWQDLKFHAEPPVAAANAALVETPLGLVLCYPGAGRQGGHIALRRNNAWSHLATFTTGACGYVEALLVEDRLVVIYESLGEIWMRSYDFPTTH